MMGFLGKLVVGAAFFYSAASFASGADHSPTADPNVQKVEEDPDFYGRYRSAGELDLPDFLNKKHKIPKGTSLDVLLDSSSCVNEPENQNDESGRSAKEACPNQRLVRVSDEASPDLDGTCYCMSRASILAQEKILFHEDGISVVKPTHTAAEEPVKKTKPRDSAPSYLSKLYSVVQDNACHKDKIAGDMQAKARIKRCVGRGKTLCECSILRCAQFTKRALVDAGLVASLDDLPGDANSPAIKSGLEKNGFFLCKDIEDPESAPYGAVLIYHSHNSKLSGDPGAPFGHIEIKTPDGYVSDFRTQKPRTTYGRMATVKEQGKKVKVFNRYLAAVYVKPPVNCKDQESP